MTNKNADQEQAVFFWSVGFVVFWSQVGQFQYDLPKIQLMFSRWRIQFIFPCVFLLFRIPRVDPVFRWGEVWFERFYLEFDPILTNIFEMGPFSGKFPPTVLDDVECFFFSVEPLLSKLPLRCPLGCVFPHGHFFWVPQTCPSLKSLKKYLDRWYGTHKGSMMRDVKIAMVSFFGV